MSDLRTARKAAGLSRKQLAKKSGISIETIQAIENQTKAFKINIGTAQALEAALNLSGKIFHPVELSHLGRPPMTGKPVSKHDLQCAHYEIKCPHCYLLVPKLPYCGYCTRPLPLETTATVTSIAS